MNKIAKPTGTYTCEWCVDEDGRHTKRFTNLSAARKHRDTHAVDKLNEPVDPESFEGTGILYSLQYSCLEFEPPDEDLLTGEALSFLNGVIREAQLNQGYRSSESDGTAITPYIYRTGLLRPEKGANKVSCAISECSSTFYTDELVASDARFICKNHTRKTQVEAVGREYKPFNSAEDTGVGKGGPVSAGDHSDVTVRFQRVQFDSDLRRAKRPEGTLHIKKQGSDVTTAKDIKRDTDG